MRNTGLALALLVSGCGSEPDVCTAPGTICTIAGTGEKLNSPDVVAALDATLDEPQDVMIAPDGTLWIIDFNFYKVRALGEDGMLRLVLGSVFGDSPRSEGQSATPSLEAKFNHFPTLTIHNGIAYIAGWHNRDIKAFNLAADLVYDIAGISTPEQYFGDGGPAYKAAVDLPSGIAIDPDGRVVWMDQANQVIRRINLDGTVERIAGQCVAGEETTPCASGEVPQTCPNMNKTVCGGDFTQCSAFCTPAFAGDGGPAFAARLAQAHGQNTDPGGRLVYAGATLYFADRDNERIRKIDPAGTISSVAGRCTPTFAPATGDFAGDGGPATDALLNWPYGIALDGTKLYIADSFNHRVRVVNL